MAQILTKKEKFRISFELLNSILTEKKLFPGFKKLKNNLVVEELDIYRSLKSIYKNHDEVLNSYHPNDIVWLIFSKKTTSLTTNILKNRFGNFPIKKKDGTLISKSSLTSHFYKGELDFNDELKVFNSTTHDFTFLLMYRNIPFFKLNIPPSTNTNLLFQKSPTHILPIDNFKSTFQSLELGLYQFDAVINGKSLSSIFLEVIEYEGSRNVLITTHRKNPRLILSEILLDYSDQHPSPLTTQPQSENSPIHSFYKIYF